jgi:hypothetical protein
MEYKKRDSLLQVEKSKKFQLVKVLSCQPRAAEKATIAVDAYGQPIEIGKWYLRSRVTKMLFPYGDQGSPQLTSSQLCTAENTGSLPFVGSVLIDTTQFLLKDNTEYGTFEMEGKVEIICFPGQQVSIHFDQEKVIGEISDSVVKK